MSPFWCCRFDLSSFLFVAVLTIDHAFDGGLLCLGFSLWYHEVSSELTREWQTEKMLMETLPNLPNEIDEDTPVPEIVALIYFESNSGCALAVEIA